MAIIMNWLLVLVGVLSSNFFTQSEFQVLFSLVLFSLQSQHPMFRIQSLPSIFISFSYWTSTSTLTLATL